MTNSHNDTDKGLNSYSEPNKATNTDNLTFIHAQLAYAKSKQGKEAKRQKQQVKYYWHRNRKGGK